jgi:predicted DNA-binding protein YlxM (UPF0122 family)
MLTEKQSEAFELYYNEDLSLSEIADVSGISRQGVRDNIKRAEGLLLEYEDKLKITERFISIIKKLSVIDSIIEDIESSGESKMLSDSIKLKINKILSIINEISIENS